MSKTPAEAPTPRPSPTKVLANSNFLRIFSAGVISTGGSAFSNLALTWVVFSKTGSAIDLALVGVASLVGSILVTLPAGVWVDRYPRRTMMVLSDLLRAACSAGLAIILLSFGFSLVSVLVVSFVWAAAGSLFQPAEQSLIPALVRTDQLADANGLIRSSRSIVSLVSNAAAGVLVLIVGAVPSFWVNAGTYLASAALVVGVVVGKVALPPGPPKERHMWVEMKEGMRWLYRQEGLFALSLSATPLNFLQNMFGAFVVVFVVILLHGTALTLGLLIGLTSFGNAFGALLVGRTSAMRHAGKAWLLAYGVGAGASILVVAAYPNVALAYLLFFVEGTVSAFGGTSWLSASQVLVPSEMQGRYYSVDGLLSFGVLPIAQVTGGILIEVYGVRDVFLIAGAGMIITGLAFCLWRALWNWGVQPGSVHVTAVPPSPE
jgi:MFS family permease